jgi:uncharacterized membrane protein YcaP (DUF421 family)
MDALYHGLTQLLGLDRTAAELSVAQMALRALVVFPCALVMTRHAGKRFLGRSAGFDIVLAIIFGSVISRAINGQAGFFPTLGAALVLVLCHRLIAIATLRSHFFSVLIKGRDCVIIRDGSIDQDKLRQAEFTPDDLLENLRLRGNVSEIADVAEARLERNGQISVVHRRKAGFTGDASRRR